jgi:hypothetical protein
MMNKALQNDGVVERSSYFGLPGSISGDPPPCRSDELCTQLPLLLVPHFLAYLLVLVSTKHISRYWPAGILC